VCVCVRVCVCMFTGVEGVFDSVRHSTSDLLHLIGDDKVRCGDTGL
jgi:hypothetical protein